MKYYVAYGSNINVRQMAFRCPAARVHGIGILRNWELLFRGAEGNAHATIARKKGAEVPVLVWIIEDEDEISLDRYEGYPKYYFKRDVMVEVWGEKKKCMVYIMDESRTPARPSRGYLETIWSGYRQCNMDVLPLRKALQKNYEETS